LVQDHSIATESYYDRERGDMPSVYLLFRELVF